VQVSVPNRLMTKLFQFVSQMQDTALEINDQRVISRAMEQCFPNLVFQNFLPPFENSNMVWFRHDLRLFRSESPSAAAVKQRGALSGLGSEGCYFRHAFLDTLARRRPLFLHIEETEAPHAIASSMFIGRRTKNR
jgi:hypothetical protein